MLDNKCGAAAEYVGTIKVAKNYGAFRFTAKAADITVLFSMRLGLAYFAPTCI